MNARNTKTVGQLDGRERRSTALIELARNAICARRQTVIAAANGSLLVNVAVEKEEFYISTSTRSLTVSGTVTRNSM